MKAKASKPVAKKPAAKKKVAVKKVVSKKPATRKAVAKKPVAKKPVAKKPVAKKPVARKPVARKPVAKKPGARKTVAAKPKAAPVKAVKAAKPAPVAAPIALAPVRPKGPPSPSQELLELILTQLDDAKAEEIVTLDLQGKSSLADTMVVANGRSNRHVGAIADQLVQKLKAHGYKDLRVEGLEQSDWVIVDTSDVIIHLFRPEVRSFYNIERLWSEHSPRETPTA